jgi:hypothetical protein
MYNRSDVHAAFHSSDAETDTKWRGNVELGNKNKGTTKKLRKGNSGPNFANVWKKLKSGQTRGNVFAERFIHDECVMHESTNIHI